MLSLCKGGGGREGWFNSGKAKHAIDKQEILKLHRKLALIYSLFLDMLKSRLHHSVKMLYRPAHMGSRLASVAFSIRVSTQNFNSYPLQKLFENVVVIQWQLLHLSVFQSNCL